MNQHSILEEAKAYVTNFIEEHQNKKIIYHTLHHTKTVVEVARQISTDGGLSNNDLLITLMAAWFVDTGYYKDYEQHEEASAQVAENFLRKAGVTDETIRDVKTCLLSTKMPQHPVNMPQKIVCDSAFFHLATPDFGEQSKLMRKELSLLQGIAIEKNGWRKSSMQFMEEHNYFTDYG